MDIRTLTGELSVTPQLTLADIRAVAEVGYRTLVCNRPDGEAPDQPDFAEIERRAPELGLQAHYLPTEPGKVSDEQATAFGQLMDECPKPMVAYCRSGLRSATMWALSQAQRMPLAQIVERDLAD